MGGVLAGLIGSFAAAASAAPVVTGGTVSTQGGFTYHTFNTSGTLSVQGGNLSNAEYLIVAGGGGGGRMQGGGGGAGGYISATATLSAGSYPVIIGAGGAGTVNSVASSGSDTSFNSVTATGGGKGAGDGQDSAVGGSGGGSGNNWNSSWAASAGISGQGNAGGASLVNWTGNDGTGGFGGGGGGRAAVGQAGNSTKAGDGGAGLQWLNGTIYAGGGGGGVNTQGTIVRAGGSGGSGGGGRGGSCPPGQALAASGTANTGGGGGGNGGSFNSVNSSGSGGSGVFILRYPATSGLPVTSGAIFHADSSSFSGSSWTNLLGTTGPATVSQGSVSLVSSSGNGANANFSTLQGDTNSRIVFPSGVLPSTYTLFHVTRYTGGTNARIYTSNTPATNWLSGHWGGFSGVAFHEGWLTQSSSSVHGNNWVISTDQNSLYRSNGVTRGTSGGSASTTLGINTYTTEQSAFQTAEVIVYNRTLNSSEIASVESYLSSKYGIAI